MNVNRNETIIDEYNKMFESRISWTATEKIPGCEKPHAKLSRGPTTWKDMFRSAWKDCELANKRQSPCLDDHHFKKEELETVGELSDVRSQIVLKRLYLADLVDLTFFDP